MHLLTTPLDVLLYYVAEDYVLVADSFAIPAGVTSGIITLTANFDEVFEGTEQVEITLMSTSEGLDVGENGAVIVSILESIGWYLLFA